jgi:hypothetical protein
MEEKLIAPEKQTPEDAEMRKKLADVLAKIPRGKKETGAVE